MLDVDIKAFFDTLDHQHLRQILDRRIRDGVVRRLIDKWLKAGVMEQGTLSYRDEGTPQGGVISPLLSNIYLHEVLDLWFEHEEDARRVHNVLPKRFERYGLTLHPEKTRLVAFAPPAPESAQRKGNHEQATKPPAQGPKREPRSFDFLGFTHHWGRSRRGQPVVQRSTAGKRLTRALKSLREWMRQHRHEPVREQWRTIKSKVQGHHAYYGISGNGRGVWRFSHEARRAWFKWLNRRGGRQPLTWDRYGQWLREVFPWPVPRIRRHSHYA